MEQRYLRIENRRIVFVAEDNNLILETDIKITNEDYDKFFELQSKGKQFRLKEIPTGNELFDYIEEYTPEIIVENQEEGIDEFMLDVDHRLSKLELGV